MIITLDGPSGSGKSTLAQKLAQKLGCFYLNSGFLYRGLAYVLVTEYGYDAHKLRDPHFHDIENCLLSGRFLYRYDNHQVSLSFGKDITPYLKVVEVSEYASLIARHEKVLEMLKEYQRNLVVQETNVVVEGRNIGTDVFPQAEAKFFVTASFDVRALRLQKDQKAFGKNLSFQEAYDLVVTRDTRDRERKHSPLIEPAGAIILDTSTATIEESLEKMLNFVKNKYVQ